MNFLTELEGLNPALIKEKFSEATIENVMRAISRENPVFEDYLYMLSDTADKALDEMALAARDITSKHFGKNIFIYAPVYISSECSNECVYCGFNRKNDIARKTLSLDEIRSEYKFLRELGIKNVLILTGEYPSRANTDYIAQAIETAKEFFSSISLEVYPMSTEDYAKLVKAGATGLTIYQETYDRKIYDTVHVAGKKKDYNWRLEAPERAAEAGFRKIGIGALLGLNDFRLEAAYLGAHAKYLMKKYWKTEISVSFPRLRGSSSLYKPAFEINDRQLVRMMLAIRLYTVFAGLTLSTRESASFRDNMMQYGVTNMSAGSKTAPGAYAEKTDATGQFEICDGRSVEEIAAAVKAKGFYPVFKDWSETFSGVKY